MPPQKVQTRQNSNRYQKRNEVNVMMNIAVVNKNQLKGIFDTDNLKELPHNTQVYGSEYKST